jgi:hypothetical protein
MTTNSPFRIHIEPYDLYGSFFDCVVGLELARRGLHHTFHACFGYVANLPDVIVQRELVASELDQKGRTVRELRTWDTGFVELRTDKTPETRQRIQVWGYFDSKEESAQCLSFLVRHLPPETTRLHDGTVSVNFWNAATVRGGCQPQRESQSMRVPQWHEIASNYPERVRPELDNTMRLKESNILLSRLMLWRGLPGTGKTWAVRALMREWLDWCTFHYVVDPAVFFSNSTYMLSLLSKVGEVAEAEYDKWQKLKMVTTTSGASSFLKTPASSSRWIPVISMDRRWPSS